MFPSQYEKERDLILSRFIPMMSCKSVLADIGCASGHWAHEVSKYCLKVDGYDYSDSLIKTAKERYENSNTHFYKLDIRSDNIINQYDGIMLFGVLMYIFDDETMFQVLDKVRNALKEGGILVTKDTLNVTEGTDLFSYNPITGYSGRYMNQNNYCRFFIKAGFTLLDDSLLMMRTIDEYGRAFISRGALWKVV